MIHYFLNCNDIIYDQLFGVWCSPPHNIVNRRHTLMLSPFVTMCSVCPYTVRHNPLRSTSGPTVQVLEYSLQPSALLTQAC